MDTTPPYPGLLVSSQPGFPPGHISTSFWKILKPYFSDLARCISHRCLPNQDFLQPAIERDSPLSLILPAFKHSRVTFHLNLSAASILLGCVWRTWAAWQFMVCFKSSYPVTRWPIPRLEPRPAITSDGNVSTAADVLYEGDLCWKTASAVATHCLWSAVASMGSQCCSSIDLLIALLSWVIIYENCHISMCKDGWNTRSVIYSIGSIPIRKIAGNPCQGWVFHRWSCLGKIFIFSSLVLLR